MNSKPRSVDRWKWNTSVAQGRGELFAVENGYRVYAVDKHFTAMAPILNPHLYQPGYGGMHNPD